MTIRILRIKLTQQGGDILAVGCMTHTTSRDLLADTNLDKSRKNRVLSDTPIYSPAITAPSSPRLHAQRPQAQTLSIPGLTKSRTSPNGQISQTASKLVIVMVGLPARGKSYIVRKLARYYNWMQHSCKIFNCGDRRRTYSDNTPQDANFFNNKNVSAQAIRENLAMDTLEDLITWVVKDGTVGIFDATNSTRLRRKAIVDRIKREDGLKALFIESICTDTELLEANMRLKLNGPDYRDQDPVMALEDFKARVRNYEAAYETIGDIEESEDIQYCKVINVGKKVVAHNIQGFLAGQAVFFMLNFNLAERQIWICRHAESEDNKLGRIGGDAELTERGRRYAQALTTFVDTQRLVFRKHQLEQFHSHPSIIPQESDHWTENPAPRDHYYNADPPLEKSFSVWTSMLQRSAQTAEFFCDEFYDVKAMKMLDEINAGNCENMTYDEIKSRYPEEYEARRRDKLQYRYPGLAGESYLDVIHRLHPIIVEIERATHHILLIGHRVTTRILLSYFLNLNREQICDMDVPLERIYCLEPRSYGTDLRQFVYHDETSTFTEEVKVLPTLKP